MADKLEEAVDSIHLTELIFGKIDDLGSRLGKYAVITMEIPWNLVKNRIGGSPASVVMTEGLDHNYLDGLVSRLPEIDTVVGIGGGVAIDTAKYVSWKRKCKAIFAPTIVSVNAYATPRAAVRYDGKVSYLGDVVPDKIVIDFEAIQSAPKRLNTAGAGDIYSCRTALFDWWLAHEDRGEPYDERIAGESKKIVERLVSNAAEIKNVSEKGIRALVELHIETNRVQVEAGSPRPEEGGEHLYFYALEELTGRQFVHGEAVGTGIFVVTYFQTGDENEVARAMDAMGLYFRPTDYGVSKEEFLNAVLGMKRYSAEARHMYTIVEKTEITRENTEKLWSMLSS